MQSEYAGSREPRPLRRRNSIASPRVPFSQFTPSLTYRSPVLEPHSDFLPRDDDLLGLAPNDYRAYAPTLPESRPKSNLSPKKRPTLSLFSVERAATKLLLILAFLGLWLTVWYFVVLYSNVARTAPTQPPVGHLRNHSAGYFHRYLGRVLDSSTRSSSHIDNPVLPHPTSSPAFDSTELAYGSTTPASLTVVLPCPRNNLASALPRSLYALSTRYLSTGASQPIVIVCPRSQSRDALRIIENLTHQHIYVRTSNMESPPHILDTKGQLETDVALLHAAAQVGTDWAIILDEDGVASLPLSTIALLYHPPRSVGVPFGPRGVVVSPRTPLCVSHQVPTLAPTPAAFLVPPFGIRSDLLREAEAVLDFRHGLGIWAALGLRIALMSRSSSTSPDAVGMGGLVVGMDDPSGHDEWCSLALTQLGPVPDTKHSGLWIFDTQHREPMPLSESFYSSLLDSHQGVAASGLFVVLLPSSIELRALAPMLCRSARLGHTLRILLYGSRTRYASPALEGCHIHFRTLSYGTENSETIDEWLLEYGLESDIVIAVAHDALAKKVIELALLDVRRARRLRETEIPLIWLAAEHLDYMEWAGTLSLREWRSWHIPKVDLSVITNDRPDSLARLLRSIDSAVYFGDQVTLHINIEQTADPWTEAQIQDMSWRHGPLVVRRRVLLGGLLPAVVESWYPSSNDSYGVLLEDDVELSPMFYAWVKMNILRYRYGHQANLSDRLFGISLYQQKNIELRPGGREPFSASSLFIFSGLPHPHIPYLSQIPCSWGAVYFPEHWRAFHAYLVDRISERTHSIRTPVIAPNARIRSNRWTRSWKKFFNEFVFLHGYVMLYPNYAGWTAFSTNHLEVGVHVRSGERDFAKKKTQFELPLMDLPPASTSSPGATNRTHYETEEGELDTRATSILDMPFDNLPRWEALPVLDLWGHLTSHEELWNRGLERYHELIADCEPLGRGEGTPPCRDTRNSSSTDEETVDIEPNADR